MAKAPKTPKAKAAEIVDMKDAADEQRQQAIDAALLAISKKYGKGAIGKISKDEVIDEAEIDRNKTLTFGVPQLDCASGIGGIPKGRIVEIYGPEMSGKTTLCLHIIAECQRAGGVAAYVDAEHSLDRNHIFNCGITDLMISQPDSGEEALDIVEDLVRSGAIDVIVVDSVAALVPKAEIEGAMGDAHMGLQARLMSQALRKLTGIISKSNTSVIFINQIRHKIGVMFGCFHEDTPITFSDGTIHSIREVVEQKLEGPVLSLDPQTNQFVPRKIINWYANGTLLAEGEQWLTITTTSAGGKGGSMSFSCTPQHLVRPWNTSEDIAAGMLHVGDTLTSWYEHKYLSDTWIHDIIYGSLLGDGTLRLRDAATAAFSIANQEQPEYLAWKLRELAPLSMRRGGNLLRPRYDSEYRAEFAMLHHQFYPEGNGYRVIPEDTMLRPLTLAVWFMDDGTYKSSHRNGSISVKRLITKDGKCMMPDSIMTQLNSICAGGVAISLSQRAITFTVSAFDNLCAYIHNYVPQCMQYKLLPEWRTGSNVTRADNPRNTQTYYVSVPTLPTALLPYPVVIKSIDTCSRRKQRSRRKYDLGIEGTENYLVGGGNRGIVVHNSPETTTGGNALKFYASMRMDMRRIDTIKNGDVAVANRCRVKFVKNKMAPPFTQTEMYMFYDSKKTVAANLIEFGTSVGVVNKTGAWYSYEEERLGQGLTNTVDFLAENQELMDRISEECREKLFVPKTVVEAEEDDIM